MSLNLCSLVNFNFLMYVQNSFATRLFILGHLYSLSLHVNYILSLFNFLLSFFNVFFLRKSFLGDFTSSGTYQFSRTKCFFDFEPTQHS